MVSKIEQKKEKTNFHLFLAGMYEGTKIFVSGLTQAMTQRFFNLVLLPRIRDDLAEFKVF